MMDPLLTEHELTLLIELLEATRRELVTEIRHTDARMMKEQLQTRLRTIDALIRRFNHVLVEQGGAPM